jgi:chaperonin GroEL (HSP60 family)
VHKALQAPARQIAENAGSDGSVVVGKLLESNDASWGYDAQAGEYTDLVARGVIDPTKVVRNALQGAASVAGLLITTEPVFPRCRGFQLTICADSAIRIRDIAVVGWDGHGGRDG